MKTTIVQAKEIVKFQPFKELYSNFFITPVKIYTDKLTGHLICFETRRGVVKRVHSSLKLVTYENNSNK